MQLQGFSVFDGERGSQCLMPFDDFIEASSSAAHIQCAPDAISARHVVSRITWCHLIDHPHLVLGKRQGGEVTIWPFGYFTTSDWLVRSPLQALLQQALALLVKALMTVSIVRSLSGEMLLQTSLVRNKLPSFLIGERFNFCDEDAF